MNPNTTHSENSEQRSLLHKRRRSSEEDWTPMLDRDTMSAGNAPQSLKLEELAERVSSSEASDDDWEVIDSCTVAVDCSHVNLQASQIKTGHNATLFSPDLIDAIFNPALTVEGGGQVTVETKEAGRQGYTASLIPACGTSLFMQVDAQSGEVDSEADLLEFLQVRRERERKSGL